MKTTTRIPSQNINEPTQRRRTTVNYDKISTTPVPINHTTMPLPFHDPILAKYVFIGLAIRLVVALPAVSIFTIISFSRNLMACCSAPLRRSREWWRENIKRGRPRDYRSNIKPKIILGDGVSKHRPLIRKNEVLHDETEMDIAFKCMRRVGREEVKSSSKKSSENQNTNRDATVGEFEKSLKRTGEEEKKSRNQNEMLRKIDKEAKQLKVLNEKCKSHASSMASGFPEADEMHKKFEEDLAQKNRKFAEELEKRRNQRRERERIANAELQKLRYESQQSISALLV